MEIPIVPEPVALELKEISLRLQHIGFAYSGGEWPTFGEKLIGMSGEIQRLIQPFLETGHR